LGIGQVYLQSSIACCRPKGISFHDYPVSELSRSSFDFGSHITLSTLRHFCYRQQRKTRYQMGLASPFWAGLSPARQVQLCLAHLDFGQTSPLGVIPISHNKLKY
jgi:hypothetical protein